jgi:hypothetical protein
MSVSEAGWIEGKEQMQGELLDFEHKLEFLLEQVRGITEEFKKET